MTQTTEHSSSPTVGEPHRPVVQFDHQSHEHSVDPAASYRALRETHPVAWTEAHGGYWVMSSYQALFDAARDDDVFSSQRLDEFGGPGLSVVIPKSPVHHHIPIELDPPEFRPYRKIVNRITAPAAVKRMDDLIKYYVTTFINDIIESGSADLTSVIGVPSAVTVDWLGLPAEDWPRYSRAHKAVLAEIPGTPAYQEAIEIDMPWISNQIAEVIHARRIEPRDDAITFLMQADADGIPMTEDDVFSVVELLIAGGVATTASLVGQTLVWLSEHTDVRQQLIENRDMLDVATEEFLRFFSPTQSLARTVIQDADFHGCPVKRGDRVLLPWASANRDPEMFENPDEIDITRWPNRHTAFGVGIHRCAGSHLGRAMAKELFTQIFDRLPDYVVDTEGLLPYAHQGVNSGWSAIPATFTPGPKLPAEYPEAGGY
jgi:cytochrome P450